MSLTKTVSGDEEGDSVSDAAIIRDVIRWLDNYPANVPSGFAEALAEEGLSLDEGKVALQSALIVFGRLDLLRQEDLEAIKRTGKDILRRFPTDRVFVGARSYA